MRTSVSMARLRAQRKEAPSLVPSWARVLLMSLSALVTSTAAHAVSAGPEDVIPQGEPPVEVSTEEPRSHEQRMLRQAVFRDRSVQCALDRAESSLKSGEVNRGVDLLQQVLDQGGDHFIWLESERRLTSARRRALMLLSSANGKTREFYDWAHSVEAGRMLERGRTTSDTALVAEVARRFFHTASGFEATDWLATRWLDRGEYALAIRAWKLLAADPCHRKRLNATILNKLEAAERLCSTGSLPTRRVANRPSDLSDSDSGRRPAPAADQNPAEQRTVDLASLEEDASLDQAAGPQSVTPALATFESEVPISRAIALNNTASAIPYMMPTWRVPLVEQQTPAGSLLSDLIRRWEAQPSQRDDRRPVVVQSALVVGDAIVSRDYAGLRALDVNSGRELWRFNAVTSLVRAMTEKDQSRSLNEGSSARDTPHDGLMAAYAANSIFGTLATDGHCVFVVDSMEIRPRPAGVPTDESGETTRGSQRLSRSANRLIAVDVHHPQRDSAGLVKPTWSVGGAVGTSHWFYRMDANDDGRVTQAEFLGTPEQFKSLDLNGDGCIDSAESVKAGDKIPQQPLHGHFFLGPPLVLDGRLYAITECDCQLNLVALSAANGTVLWVQGIGYVDRPIDEEALRYPLACTPSSGAGVIVCPTQAGILVGVDALDGALLWTYYCGDEDGAAPESSWSFTSRHTFGNPGFPQGPLVEGSQVVVLPRQSESIQCLDLVTGRGIWKKPRGDGEFVAAAVDGIVMVVGERLCRGLSLADGSERWSIRIGEASGCGVRLGSEYLLPLADNRIAAIEIRSGARRGNLSAHDDDSLEKSAPESEQWWQDRMLGDENDFADRSDVRDEPSATPGNLVFTPSLIVSCGTREVVAYPRAEALLEKVERKIDAGSRSPADLALAADLELTLGRVSAAKAYLSEVAEETGMQDLASRSNQLKRTVLLEELAAGCSRPTEQLRALEALSRTPGQRFRFLRAKSEVGIRNGNLGEVLESNRSFATVGSDDLVASRTDPAFLTSARGWLAETDQRVSHSFAMADLERLRPRIAAEQKAALESNDCGALERFIAAYGSWPEADAARLRLVAITTAAGQLQRAELILLGCERCPRPETVRAARQQLVRLWERAGLGEEAADLLFELEKRDALEQRDPAETLRLIAEFRSDSLTRRALKRLKSAQQSFGPARISQSFSEHCNPELAEKYANSARQFVTRASTPFQLIDAGSSSTPKISIVDRLSGTVVGGLEMPPYWGGTLAVTSQVGHFIPLGSRAAFHGVSLLERDVERPIWTTAPARIAKDPDSTYVGPSGPTFCVFQAHRHLFVVDPGTGRLIWHRTDLDPQSGLVADSNHGIVGDEEALVVFGSDHSSYTVYATATGEELRQGSLDPTAHQIPERRAFGRRLLYFSSHDGSHRMRIWDPLTDRLIYDAAVCDRLLWKETGEGEVAVITATEVMQIVDGHSGAIRAELKLDGPDFHNLCQVSAFRTADCYYVNLQSMQPLSEPKRYAYCFGSDTSLPHTDLRGNLVAIERESGRVLWKRNFPHRTVLRVPTLRLPVLVMLALVGDRLNGNHKSMLVEVVDAKTGQTLAFDDDRKDNHVLQMTYDDDQQRIRLWGTKSVVDLDFGTHSTGQSVENRGR
jgi:outer membrane protein assembly factor BamB